MNAPPAAADDWLGAWLQRLHDDGFRLGTRERLLAHALLARCAVAGTLPANPSAAARLLRPLLCRSAVQQRRYDELLAEWRGEQAPQAGVARARSRSERRRNQGEPTGPSTGTAWALLALVVLLSLALARWWPQPADTPLPAAEPTASAPAPGTPSASAPAPVAASAPEPVRRGIYVPKRTLPVEPPAPPAWAGPLRVALLVLAAASAALLLWLAWQRWRRELSLKAVRTDQPVDERVLHARAEQLPPVTPPPAVLRPASRLLRQRTAGAREEIDLPATLRATIEAAGAFTPRTRTMAQTPEYLVLVDRRGPADHLARWQRALLDALAGSGVAISVYAFEQTPALGCWRERGDGSRFDRSALAELGGRFAGQRLLVFADPAVALDPRRGTPLPWAAQLRRDFPDAAWFTPRPVTSWAGPEYALADARELGFLVLPLMAEAVETLAGWFASGRAHLDLPEDMAGPWPPTLGDDPFALALRHAPPAPEVVERLLRELRQYLGTWRFQWLAACAVFPALSWPLTLALGQALLDAAAPGTEADTRTDGPAAPVRASTAVAVGAPLLGALPWFRYGRMPDWLREALIARLGADAEARCRRLIEQRLDEALTSAPATDELARVALRRAWLRRGDGVAQDRLLVDFLRGADRVSRLVQRVPERLRRALFRRGNTGYGLRPGWLALPVAGVLAGVFAASPGWQQSLPVDGDPRLALAGQPMPALERPVESLEVSPDGLRLLVRWQAQPVRPALSWLAAGDGRTLAPQPAVGDGSTQAAMLEEDGSLLIGRDEGGQLFVYALRDGRSTGRFDPRLVMRTYGLSADGRTMVLRRDGEVTVTRMGERSSTETLPRSPFGAFVEHALAGDKLWLADSQGRLWAWSIAAGRWTVGPLHPPPGADARTLLAADPQGEYIAASRITGEVAVMSAADGTLRARFWVGGAATAVAFDADGSSLLVAHDGRLSRYGRPAGEPLRVIACRRDDPALQAGGEWQALFAGQAVAGVDPAAYTPAAAWSSGQLPAIVAGEVLHDPARPRQLAVARDVLTWLQSRPVAGPAGGWRLREAPGLLAVTAYVCAEDERIDEVTGPVASPAPPPASVPEPARLVAGMNFEVFECTPGDAASAAVARDAEAALRRLGAASVRRSALPAASFESRMGSQFAPYELRVSLGHADESQAARALLAEPAFARLAPWQIVPVRQVSRRYVSVIVCPARWTAGSGVGATSPAAAAQSAPTVQTVQTAQTASAPPGPAATPDASGAPRGAVRATVVAASEFLANDPTQGEAFARRLLAQGDHWFSIGDRAAVRTSNVLVELGAAEPWLVVNASNPAAFRAPARLDDPALLQLLGGPRSRRFDALLVSAGLDAVVDALGGASPLLSPAAAEAKAKGTGERISAAALAALNGFLRARVAALVRARDAGPNRGVPLLLGTYDYPTPRAAGAGFGTGPWLLPAMEAAGIPPAEQAAVARELIDRLAEQLMALAADRTNFPDVYVVDTRGTLVPASADSSGASGDWINEITPTSSGYRKLAARWQLAIERAIAASGPPAKGR